MYSRESNEFLNSHAAVIEKCFRKSRSSEAKPVAILGGHFMLMYNRQEDILMPCVWQDIKDKKEKDFARLVAGDFPAGTFEMALKLQKKFSADSIDSKIMIVINDHKFQSRSFQPSAAEFIKGKAGKLRHEFYRSFTELPGIFLKLLQKFNFSVGSAILENYQKDRKQKEVLPKRTLYFSEQVLQNRFDNYRLPKLLKGGVVNRIPGKGDNELYMYLMELHRFVCLTEDGSCGCAGLTIELIAEAFEKKFYNLVLMVPNECADAVNLGIAIAMNLLRKKSIVICVSNLGGSGPDSVKLSKHNIQIAEHRYNAT